jgi:hypothetical protein
MLGSQSFLATAKRQMKNSKEGCPKHRLWLPVIFPRQNQTSKDRENENMKLEYPELPIMWRTSFALVCLNHVKKCKSSQKVYWRFFFFFFFTFGAFDTEIYKNITSNLTSVRLWYSHEFENQWTGFREILYQGVSLTSAKTFHLG